MPKLGRGYKVQIEFSEQGEATLSVGNEDDGFLSVSWWPPIDAQGALAVLNALTQALDRKLTGSCANERILAAYQLAAQFKSQQEHAHG